MDKLPDRLHGVAFSIKGCGFNGFQQQQLSSLKTCCTQKSHEAQYKPTFFSVRGRYVAALETLVMVDITQEPIRIYLSSAWDATFVFIEFQSCLVTLSSPKWFSILNRISESLDEGDVIKRVWEHGKGSLLLVTARKQVILVDGDCDQISTPDVVGLEELIVLSDNQIFCHMSDKKIYQCSIHFPNLSLGGPCAGDNSFIKVASGQDHVLLLNDAGCVYSFGLGTRGQLGHGDISSQKEPKVLEALRGIHIKDIACGNWHSLALSEYGDVYSWGWNEHRQLGHSPGHPVMSTPTIVELKEDEQFTGVAAGSRHSAAVSDKGLVYVWGWNGYGQLGTDSSNTTAVPSTGIRVLNNDLDKTNLLHVHLSYWNTFICEFHL